LTPAQREALEARFALRVGARLHEGAAALPHDISERLRVAREQAVRAARPATAPVLAPVAPPVPVAVLTPVAAGVGQAQPKLIKLPGAHSVGRDHGRHPTESPLNWGWRLATVLPVLALLGGLWGIQAYFRAEKVQAASELDVELLSDELPPSAYADPGFAEFLRTGADAAARPIDTEVEEPDGDLQTEETDPADATP
jgi:hypothetical protein